MSQPTQAKVRQMLHGVVSAGWRHNMKIKHGVRSDTCFAMNCRSFISLRTHLRRPEGEAGVHSAMKRLARERWWANPRESPMANGVFTP